jgi:hypothetical protein
MKVLKQSSRMIATSESWHPSYPGDFVRASVVLYDFCEYPSNKYPRRSVTKFGTKVRFAGADDTEIERYRDFGNLDDARNDYELWVKKISKIGLLSIRQAYQLTSGYLPHHLT